MPHKLTNILTRVPSDIEIAQAATPLPIDQIAAEAGILPDELDLYGKTKAKVHLSIRDRLKNSPNGKYIVVTAITPTPLGEGKTTTTVGLEPGAGRAPGQESVHVHSPAQPGPHVRHQGRRGRRRLQPDHSDGGVQSPSHRRHSRHHRGEQSSGGRDRCAHVSRAAAPTTNRLFERLCPPSKDGSRKFSPVMLRRLRKLGISKTDPNELTPEERSRFARLDIDPDTHHVAARAGHQRSHAARRSPSARVPRRKASRASPASTSRWPARSWRFWRWPPIWPTCASGWGAW